LIHRIPAIEKYNNQELIIDTGFMIPYFHDADLEVLRFAGASGTVWQA